MDAPRGHHVEQGPGNGSTHEHVHAKSRKPLDTSVQRWFIQADLRARNLTLLTQIDK